MKYLNIFLITLCSCLLITGCGKSSTNAGQPVLQDNPLEEVPGVDESLNAFCTDNPTAQGCVDLQNQANNIGLNNFPPIHQSNFFDNQQGTIDPWSQGSAFNNGRCGCNPGELPTVYGGTAYGDNGYGSINCSEPPAYQIGYQNLMTVEINFRKSKRKRRGQGRRNNRDDDSDVSNSDDDNRRKRRRRKRRRVYIEFAQVQSGQYAQQNAANYCDTNQSYPAPITCNVQDPYACSGSIQRDGYGQNIQGRCIQPDSYGRGYCVN